MKLVALIPSYDRKMSLARTISGVTAHVKPDDIVVLEQERGLPLGLGKARRMLVDMAYRKHGSNAIYLMLDDDVDFSMFVRGTGGSVQDACGHFSDDPLVGLVQLLNGTSPAVLGGRLRYRSLIMHSFLIRGAVIDGGGGVPVNYTDGENMWDEGLFSLQAYMAGWRTGISPRARILRHMIMRNPKVRGRNPEMAYDPKARGGNEGAVQCGAPCQSKMWETLVDTGYADVRRWYWRGEKKIPIQTHVVLTDKGKGMHDVALRERARRLGVTL